MIRKSITKFITRIVESVLKEQKENKNGYTNVSGNNELETDKYLYDFKARFSSTGLTFSRDIVQIQHGNISLEGEDSTPSDSDAPVEKPLQQKIMIKPIDALRELETVPTPFNCEMIDEKIEVMELKRKFIQNNYSRNDVDGLIERFKARKKYNEHFEFYSRFQNTTDEKIEKLLSKYQLVMKPSDLFIPEFPTEAIRIMAEYEEKTMLITGKKCIYYVIADEDKFRKAYERRDPILLVQSPFGFFWQILGAWDKEMLVLGEL